MPQETLSRFFAQSPVKKSQGKRPASPIDLTADSDSEAPRKKPRNTSHTRDEEGDLSISAGQSAPRRKQVHAPAEAEQWRYEPPSPDKPRPEKARSAAEEEKRRKTHEAFRKRLLDENSSFVRIRGGVINDDGDIVQETESRKGKDRDRDEGEESAGGESGDESDAAFASFKEVLAKSKGKGPQAVARKKKVEEVGPSGQPWTPLEKQVRIHQDYAIEAGLH